MQEHTMNIIKASKRLTLDEIRTELARVIADIAKRRAG